MQARSRQVLSPAKINLFLNIKERRADGFHNLETLMAPLALADTVTVELSDSGFSVECNMPDVPCDDRNLAIRAAKKLAEAFSVTQGAHITLQKRIPAAGGLGGGSSNAAATLIALNDLWDLKANAEQLHPIATALGSDVPFFLQNSPALCGGRGELIHPLRLGVELGVLLVNPGFGISTKWAYDALAAQRKAGHTNDAPTMTMTMTNDEVIAALKSKNGARIQACLVNSLESPCLEKYPLLEVIKEAMPRHGALGAMMSGSGSTMFALTETEEDAEILLKAMRRDFGPKIWMCATKTVDGQNGNG